MLNILEQSQDQLEGFLYNPINAFKPVNRGEFRYEISFEDLIINIQENSEECIYEKTLDGDVHPTIINGIYSLRRPIKILDTYNPFAKVMQKKIDDGTLTLSEIIKFDIKGYENPALANKPTTRFISNVSWLVIINPGIDKLGLKKLATYIINVHTQRHIVTHERMMELLIELYAQPKQSLMNYIEEHRANFIREVGVFYADNSTVDMVQRFNITRKNCDELNSVEKRSISKQYFQRNIDKVHKTLIGAGISQLKDIDSYTKISDTRLSFVTGLSRAMVSRKKSIRHKIEIKKTNKLRPFKKEDMSSKYQLFCSEFFNKTTREMTEWLGISNRTYYEFKSLMEEEQGL